MKPIRPPALFSILSILGPCLASSGCRVGQDRQMVFTAPRSAPVRVKSNDGARVKAPFVDSRVSPGRRDAAPRGVDVPIVESE